MPPKGTKKATADDRPNFNIQVMFTQGTVRPDVRPADPPPLGCSQDSRLLPTLAKMSKCLQKVRTIFSDFMPVREHYCAELTKLAVSLTSFVKFDMAWKTVNAAAQGLVQAEGEWLTHDDVVEFHARVCVPFVSELAAELRDFTGMTPLMEAFGLFDPRGPVLTELPDVLPDADPDVPFGVDLSNAKSTLKKITDYFGGPAPEALSNFLGPLPPPFLSQSRCTVLESELCAALKFIKLNKCVDYCSVLRLFLGNSNTRSAFPETTHLLSIIAVLPIGTATVERLFSFTKLVKTRLRKKLKDATFADIAMLAMNAKYSVSHGFPVDHLKKFVDDWKCLDHKIYFASMDEYLQRLGTISALRQHLLNNRRILLGAMRTANAGQVQAV